MNESAPKVAGNEAAPWPSLKLTGPDNLNGVNVQTSAAPRTIFEEAALYKHQRDEAWIEVAQLHDELHKLRSVLAHYNPPDPDLPKHAMPRRDEE